MAVSVTGPRAVNELGGPVTPGSLKHHSFIHSFLYALGFAVISRN